MEDDRTMADDRKGSTLEDDKKESRCALLIRCTQEEANAIREAARLQRRTVSAFVLQAVMRSITVQQRLAVPVQKLHNHA